MKKQVRRGAEAGAAFHERSCPRAKRTRHLLGTHFTLLMAALIHAVRERYHHTGCPMFGGPVCGH